MPKNSRAKRNVTILLLLIVGLSILVFLAMGRKTEPVMPPEDPEIQAKRRSRASAYYAFEEAAEMLSNLSTKDHKLVSKHVGEPIEPARLEREAASIEETLKKAKPVIEKARAGLEKPYYLLPEIPPADPHHSFHRSLYKFRGIEYLFILEARQKAAGGDIQGAFDCLFDAIKTARMISNDGPIVSFLVSMDAQQYAVRDMCVLAGFVESTELLRSVRDRLGSLIAEPPDVEKNLEFDLRMLDRTLVKPPREEVIDKEKESAKQFWRGFGFRLAVQRLQKYVGEHEEQLRQLVNMPYPEYARRDRGDYMPGRRAPIVRRLASDIDSLQYFRAKLETWQAGTMIVLALILYERDNEALPGKLEALSPDYLEAVPDDPFAQAPFRYHVRGDDYLLYSVFKDLDDDNASPKEDLIIHEPSAPANAVSPTKLDSAKRKQ